jgi:hypothetical protein
METRKGNSGPIAQIFHTAAALDVANIGAGATLETAVTIPGAAVGDIVTAAPRTALAAGLVFNNCRVSAADTVQLAITNITGGALDPAANTWDFVVNKP